MDNAVALVEAYLRMNGYSAVAEYPFVEAMRQRGHRVATDLDILAFRFPGAGRLPLCLLSIRRDHSVSNSKQRFGAAG